jgi:hypothetical protein
VPLCRPKPGEVRIRKLDALQLSLAILQNTEKSWPHSVISAKNLPIGYS